MRIDKALRVIKPRRAFSKPMPILGIGSFCAVPLYVKRLKETVKYQEVSHQGKRGMGCLHFISAANECTTIEGSIDQSAPSKRRL